MPRHLTGLIKPTYLVPVERQETVNRSNSRLSYLKLFFAGCLIVSEASCNSGQATQTIYASIGARQAESIRLGVVIDSDSNRISDPELSSFVVTANELLLRRTRIGVQLSRVDRISYSGITTSSNEESGPSTTQISQVLTQVYRNQEFPEYLVIFRADVNSARYGAYSVDYHDQVNLPVGFCNRFRTHRFGSAHFPIAVVDWSHHYGTCGYDYTNPRNPVHVSDHSLNGECSNQEVQCRLNSTLGYYRCDDELRRINYTGPYDFAAGSTIHELLHAFGFGSEEDHFTPACLMRARITMPEAELERNWLFMTNFDICPDVVDAFADSYRPC